MDKKRIKRKKQTKRPFCYTQKQLWNLSSYLAKDLHDVLIQFKKENINSFPGKLNTQEEWFDILNKMIYSFYEIANDYPGDPINNRKKYGLAEFPKVKYFKNEEGYTQMEFEKEPEDAWIKMRKDSDAYHCTIQEGLDLFAAYFQTLWD